MKHIHKINEFSSYMGTNEIQNINFAFEKVKSILDKVNETYSLITESYGENEAELFEAGFLSNFRNKVSNLGAKAGEWGHKVGQTARDVKNWTKDTYQKGVEYGSQLITAMKEFCGKIVDFFASAYQWVVSAPEKFWNKMQEGWNTVVSKLVELKEKASNKFQLEVGFILEDMSKKLCKKLRELTGDMQMGDYAIARKRPAEFFGKYEKFKGTLLAVGNELVKSEKEKVKQFGRALLNALQSGAENVGIFLLGIILGGFWVAGWVHRKLVDFGLSFSDVVGKFVDEVEKEVPAIWQEVKGVKTSFSTGFKGGYNEPVKSNSVEDEDDFDEMPRESHIIRFDRF